VVRIPSSGVWSIAVRATDAAGNWSRWWSRQVHVDAGIPVLRTIRASHTLIATADARFSVSWSGTDNVRVTSYEWRVVKVPDGVPSAPHATTSRSASFKLGAGTWLVQVRARDAARNASAWRSVRVFVPRDDRAFSFSEGTHRWSPAGAYRHTLTTTSVKNATITTSCEQCRSFVLIGRAGPRYGKLVVTVDGQSTIVDTATLHGRRVTANHEHVTLFSTSFAPGAHEVTIRNLGTSGRPTIAIDGLGFSV
jgi:hypothetical protein